MAAGTLYTYPDNFRAFKVQIAAQYSGANIKVVKDPPQFKLGETNKSDEFLKKFPLGKVPAFETNDGVCLFESNAIAQFVGNEQLRGNNAKDAAFIQQWINLADNEILPAACTWVYPCLGIMQFNKQNTERAKEDLKKVMSVLNNHLLTRTFLVGERVTLADISVACNLLSLYQNVFDPSFRAPFGNVNRYFNTLINQPQFKAVLGDVKLAEKMAVFDSKKYAEFHAKPGGGKKDKKEKQPQQAKKQPEKKKEKKEEEDDEPPKPKENKDPFAALPEGTFVMDTWKKTYSNNDTTKIALPYFWENFDKENYSIWFCEYSYPEDLTMVFMSCNLMGGMMQRLDRMRKHSFGSMCLFGENDDSTISGVWIWRGQNLAFELHDDLQVDYSSYAWRKLDPNTEETKKLVDNYFRHEDFTNPRPFNQGKIFK